MLKVYTYNTRSVLEYAAQISQDIPAYLSDAIESIQRRALRIIFPNSSYQQALDQPNLTCRQQIAGYSYVRRWWRI